MGHDAPNNISSSLLRGYVMMGPPNELSVYIESLGVVPGWSVCRFAMLVPMMGAVGLRGEMRRYGLRAYICCANNGFWFCCSGGIGMDIRLLRAGLF